MLEQEVFDLLLRYIVGTYVSEEVLPGSDRAFKPLGLFQTALFLPVDGAQLIEGRLRGFPYVQVPAFGCLHLFLGQDIAGELLDSRICGFPVDSTVLVGIADPPMR